MKMKKWNRNLSNNEIREWVMRGKRKRATYTRGKIGEGTGEEGPLANNFSLPPCIVYWSRRRQRRWEYGLLDVPEEVVHERSLTLSHRQYKRGSSTTKMGSGGGEKKTIRSQRYTRDYKLKLWRWVISCSYNREGGWFYFHRIQRLVATKLCTIFTPRIFCFTYRVIFFLARTFFFSWMFTFCWHTNNLQALYFPRHIFSCRSFFSKFLPSILPFVCTKIIELDASMLGLNRGIILLVCSLTERWN